MSWNDFGDNWLKNGLPTFHGGKDKNHARTSLDKLGGPDGFKTAITIQPDGTKVVVQTKGAMPPQVFVYPPTKAEAPANYTVKTTIDVYLSGYDLGASCPTSMLRIELKADGTFTSEFPAVERPGMAVTAWANSAAELHMQTNSVHPGGNERLSNLHSTFPLTGATPFGRIPSAEQPYNKLGPNSEWGPAGTSNRSYGENARPFPPSLFAPYPPGMTDEQRPARACKKTVVNGVETTVYVALQYGGYAQGYTPTVVTEMLIDGTVLSSSIVDISAQMPPASENVSIEGVTYSVTRTCEWGRRPFDINASCTKMLAQYTQEFRQAGATHKWVLAVVEIDLRSAAVSTVCSFEVPRQYVGNVPSTLLFGYDADTPRVVKVTRRANDSSNPDLSGAVSFGAALVTGLSYTPIGTNLWAVTATGVPHAQEDYSLTTTVEIVGGSVLDSWTDWIVPTGASRGTSDYDCTGFYGEATGSAPPNLQYNFTNYTVTRGYREATQSAFKIVFFSPAAGVLVACVASEKRHPFVFTQTATGGNTAVSVPPVTYSESHSLVVYNLITGKKQVIHSGSAYSITTPAGTGNQRWFPMLANACNGGIGSDYYAADFINYVSGIAASVSDDGLTLLLSFMTADESVAGFTEILDPVYGFIGGRTAEAGAVSSSDVAYHNYVLSRGSKSADFSVKSIDLSSAFAFAGEPSIGNKIGFVPYFVSSRLP